MASPVKKSKNSTEITNENTIENINENINDSVLMTDIENTKEIQETTSTISPSEVAPVSNSEQSNAQSTNEILLQTIANMQKQMEMLTAKVMEYENKPKEEVKQENVVTQQPFTVPVPVPVKSTSTDTSAKLLEYLTSKKSDREVVLVHGQELGKGLSTAIRLTGISIDFHNMGEQRVLSWIQFEECVSKYKSWFDRKIIMLSYEDRELAERYGVHYVGEDGQMSLTKELLVKLPTLTIPQLENLFTSLCKEDQNTLCSYWIGKCYERVSGFYDRYKVDCLHRLSQCGAFENIIVNMNYDYKRDQEEKAKNNTTVNDPRKIVPRIDAVDI